MQDPMAAAGPIRIATRVPLDQKRLAISLNDIVPLSSTWYLTFSASFSGQVRLPLSVSAGRSHPTLLFP